MPIRRIEIPQDILDGAEKLGRNESPEETLALWLKRGHDTDENVSEAYEAFDVLVASEKVQKTGTIGCAMRKKPRNAKKQVRGATLFDSTAT